MFLLIPTLFPGAVGAGTPVGEPWPTHLQQQQVWYCSTKPSHLQHQQDLGVQGPRCGKGITRCMVDTVRSGGQVEARISARAPLPDPQLPCLQLHF